MSHRNNLVRSVASLILWLSSLTVLFTAALGNIGQQKDKARKHPHNHGTTDEEEPKELIAILVRIQCPKKKQGGANGK